MELRIENITKSYENKPVLNIESLKIPQGSFLGIIGPNGAGKSTLVKIMAGIEAATSGDIYYDGQPLHSSLMKQMTLIFQKPYLLRTSVFQNIAYPLILRGFTKNEINKRVKELIDQMEINHIKNQKAWTLSGGEAQKVALARGLVFHPKLLILDEFTANIDPASMLVMENNIKEYYKAQSPTIIMVTHNIQQAKRLCSEIAFMNHGTIEEMGAAFDMFHHPLHPSTKRFISGEIVI
ncbi:ABC transporter ATP-binding protein [Alkaliphilus crotonatoxidans]